ncbi:hypothetical protein TNCV_398651 [Trichonephila clavipes]|uniref:Uncharacterized protein n=1 Tax=Trichonephila clavipes TaxID=2585209 RepID=A0A8X6VTU1_TRICX|nr:hypothetical protein TNCV_398651 [Trichonephila clavipes]
MAEIILTQFQRVATIYSLHSYLPELSLEKSTYVIYHDVIDFFSNFQKHPYGPQTVKNAHQLTKFACQNDLNRFLETGSAGRRPGQGRRRATTPNEDRYLVFMARRH